MSTLDQLADELSLLRTELEALTIPSFEVGALSDADPDAGTATLTFDGIELEGVIVPSGYVPEAGHVVPFIMNGLSPVVMAPVGPPASASPDAPTGLSAVGTVAGVLVQWTGNTDANVRHNLGYYEVQWDDNNTFTSSESLTTPATTAVLQDLTPGVTVYVRVRAVNYAGTASAWSTTVDADPVEVDASIIAAGTITATEIADNAISTPKLAAGAVTAAKITAGTITGNEIAATTITGGKIAAGTISATNIAAGTITAVELAALTLTSGKYIRSTSYVAGTAGWNIDADGTADLNDVTVRGRLVASTIEADTSVNLVPNGTFDVNATGWSATTNCSIARVTSTPSPQSGAGSLKITPTGAGDVVVRSTTGTGGIPIEPNTAYEIRRYVRSQTATHRATRCTPLWYDSGGTIIASPNADIATAIDNSSGWTKADPGVSLSPPNAAFMAIELKVLNTGGASEWHAVDEVTVFKGSRFDGGLLVVPRLVIADSYDDTSRRIDFRAAGDAMNMYTGETDETGPAYIRTSLSGSGSTAQLALDINAPFSVGGATTPMISLRSPSIDGTSWPAFVNFSDTEISTDAGASYATKETAYGTFASWTGSVTNPTGRAWVGHFVRIGKHVTGWITGSFPGAMTAGSGAYTFALPFAVDTAVTPVTSVIGEWIAEATAGGTTYAGSLRAQTSTTARLTLAGGGSVTAAAPFVPVTGSAYSLHFDYIAA